MTVEEEIAKVLGMVNNTPGTDKIQQPMQVFEVSFGIKVRFYPNGTAYIQSTWPLGKPKPFKKKPKKQKQLAKVQEDEEEIL